MAVPFILYNNIYETGTLTAFSESPGFDIENIIDWRSYVRWKATSATTQTIDLDYGSSVPSDAFGVSGHTLSGSTISIQVSATGAWAGEQTTVPGTSFALSDNLDICKSFSSVSSRYWRFLIQSPSATPEIGVLCLGARLDFPKNPNRPLSFVDESMEATSRRSKNGHILGATTYYRPYSVIMSFSWLQISFVQGDLYTFWSTHGSLLKPFFLQVNIDEWDVGRFVQLPENYRFKEVFDDYTFTTDLQMTFEGIL